MIKIQIVYYYNICIQTVGNTNSAAIENLIERTKNRLDFQGLDLIVNYIHLVPYCIVKEGDFSGVFPDLARAIASNLNMTLKIQSLKEENKGIYSRR